MEYKNYERSEDFERNEAVYVLHTIDKKSLEEIAASFHLALEEIQQIISVHAKYEAAVLASYQRLQ